MKRGRPSGDGSSIIGLPRRALRMPVVHRHRFRTNQAFTLIELLLVISILVLLMALLFPALTGARKQAQAIVCQARLRQLGQLAALHAQDSPGEKRFISEKGIGTTGGIGVDGLLLRAHRLEDVKLRLCPSATRVLEGDPLPWGDTFRAYSLGRVSHTAPPEKRTAIGYASIGVNHWLGVSPLSADGLWIEQGWRTTAVKRAAGIPVFFDSATLTVKPRHLDPPRQHEHICEHYDYQGYLIAPSFFETSMSPVCLNRHNESVNMVFMDWSVRKVGLKELWTFKWHPGFDTTGPWTKAGGVLPEDWHSWMRRFKDY